MHPHRSSRWYLLAFFLFVADQVVKSIVDALTPLGWSQPIAPFFNLVHVLNPGAAFRFLAGAGGWQRWFFLAIALAASAWLIWMLREPRPRSESLALSLILGGALGNGFDRAVRGHVIDYLDFHLGSWHWPAFNLADIGITVGAVCLVLAWFIGPREPATQEKA
jgi:signal peptidase II